MDKLAKIIQVIDHISPEILVISYTVEVGLAEGPEVL
jgi:hypothetical protein